MFPFELTSILILIAILGALVLARKESMSAVPISYYLVLSAVLFGLGVMAFVFKRNIITIFMSIELMLNAVNLAFVAFSRALGQLDGQVFVFFVIVVAAAEAAVGLAIVSCSRSNRAIAQRGTREFAEALMPATQPSLDHSAAAAAGRRGQWPFRQALAAIAPSIRSPSAPSVCRFWPPPKRCANSATSPRTRFPASGTISPGWSAEPAASFRADFALQVDQLTVVMLLVVTGVGWLIHIYSTGYMAHEGGYHRFFSYLNLFMFFMLTLVLAANLILMFVGWEGVGLCSYLLIGFCFLKKSATNAGNKAFMVNRIGDFGFTARHPARVRDIRHRCDFGDNLLRAAHARRSRGQARSRRSACCCSPAPPANPRSFRCTSGCRTRWKAPRRSAR